MTRKQADLAASVRTRLLRLSRERNEDFNRILNRYAIERLLYRLSQSRYRDQFVLKGATLLLPLVGAVYRPTRDLDLLNLGSPDSDRVMRVFRELCELSVEPDGLSFDSDTIRLETIRENQPYPNHRVKFEASLAGAIIVVQVDVAFGDAIAAKLEKVVFPGLLDLPESEVLAYPKEAVIAEKLEAIVSLGVANSRMKDYYDLSIFSKTFEFDGTELTQAMRATFEKKTILSTFWSSLRAHRSIWRTPRQGRSMVGFSAAQPTWN